VKYNILITGSNGQLGSELKELSNEYNYNFLFTDRENLDITNKSAIDSFIAKNSINVIINCAAFTAVDKAQESVSEAYNLNHLAVEYLAQIAKKNGIKLIHISTDYLFNGKTYKPYKEIDRVDPINIYGDSKLKGEQAILKINPKESIIIRTSWLYSSYGNNFVKTMLKLANKMDELGIIFDQTGTPTYAKDLAKTILSIIEQIENRNVEIYHYSNEGVASWYDFAKAIFEIENINIKVNPIETKEYPTPAKRPYYTVLNKAKIKESFNITIPHWRDSLRECLNKIESKKDV